MRRTVIGFLAVVSMMMVSVGCASLTPPPPEVKMASLPDPKPGSWWVIRKLDGNLIRKDLVDVKNGEFVVLLDGRKTHYTSAWNWTENLNQRGTIRDKYTESNSFLSFPLYPGKTWIVNVGWTGRRGLMSGGTFSVSGEVGRWSLIEIEAGTFDAIRIEVLVNKTTAICWYAERVQHLAACTYPFDPDRNWEVAAFHLAD